MRLIRALQAVVDRYPSQMAVEDERESLTYESLWRRAQELSRRLLSDQSNYVLIQEPRSCRLLVRLLAVWLAGHAPLMLDPQTPPGRLQEILGQVKPRAFFQGDELIVYKAEALNSAEAVEYLVATSGSTGKPKLVMVGVGSLVPMLRSQIEAFQLDLQSKVLWMLSPGFDASFSDIGTALLSGAKLICGSQGIARELLGVLSEQGVTHLDIPPSLLLRFRPGEFPASLRCLVVGGEPSPAEFLGAWSKFHRVVAVYGPSEATVCASLSVVDEQWDRAYIGPPLPGVEFETQGGELLIGGSQVALGYLGEESSAFHQREGMAWYRSGDLVGSSPHWRHGFEFKGRRDRQVQLRGQRLELQEIELRASEILAHGEVVALVQEGILRLYWRQGSDPVGEELQLRRALSQAFAPSCLPGEYHPLRELPRGVSGKVDRGALPDLPCRGDLDSLQRISMSLDLERQGVISTDFLARQADRLACELSAPKRPSKRSKPRLLVTGLQGNLGRALEPLLQEDFKMWSLSRKQGGPRTLRGDLALPHFGLDPGEWEFLLREVDQVLHLAALLDLSKSYRELKAVNASCLAGLSKIGSPLHLASTMAVTLSALPASLAGEEAPDSESLVYGGYAQSKWVADRALALADFPGFTFRYGQLLGTPGVDLLATVIRGLRDLGSCPRVEQELPLYFDITPMDWAARETASALRQGTEARCLMFLRRGLQAHFQDLAELMVNRGLLERVEKDHFFALRPSTPSAAVALRALWKCQAQARPGFDLFLLGNLGLPFESTELARNCLESYLTAVLEAELPRAHRECPAEVPDESPTRPSA